MSILVCERGLNTYDKKFSKELFKNVRDNLKLFSDEEWELAKKDYKEVMIAVYIRTDIDNLVLTPDGEEFAVIMNAPSFMLSGGMYHNLIIDLGIMCAKRVIDSTFNFEHDVALHRFVGNSACYPVGVADSDDSYVFAFNVIMSSDLLKDPCISLRSGFHFHPIESLTFTDSLQKAISESLVIVNNEE